MIIDIFCCRSSLIKINYNLKSNKNEEFLSDLKENILSFDNLEVKNKKRGRIKNILRR